MAQPSDTQGYEFRYPAAYQWLFAICAVPPGASCALLVVYGAIWESGLAFPVSLALGVAMASLWYSMQGRISIDAGGVSLTRLGRTTRIDYAEVTAVRDLRLRGALVIRSAKKRIRVEKQLEGFALFERLLYANLPRVPGGYRIDLPLELPVLWWYPAVGVLLLAGGVPLVRAVIARLRLPITMGGDRLLELALLLFGVLLCFGLGANLVFVAPRRYLFGHEQVEVFYPLRHKAFPLSQLTGLRLVRVGTFFNEQTSLLLSFGKDRVWLGGTVDYPMELLAQVLSAHYAVPTEVLGRGA